MLPSRASRHFNVRTQAHYACQRTLTFDKMFKPLRESEQHVFIIEPKWYPLPLTKTSMYIATKIIAILVRL